MAVSCPLVGVYPPEHWDVDLFLLCKFHHILLVQHSKWEYIGTIRSLFYLIFACFTVFLKREIKNNTTGYEERDKKSKEVRKTFFKMDPPKKVKVCDFSQ